MSEFRAEDWERYAGVYDALNDLSPYSEMLQDVINCITENPYPLLDAGCGTGNLLSRLKLTSPSRAVGIDSSLAMLERAKLKCANVAFHHANLNVEIPFNDRSFSTVVCVNALYATVDPAKTLLEFGRLLSPGGTLIVVTPKQGYENGLILKSHCRSRKPDSYWLHAHRDKETQERLVREAIPNTNLADRMLEIASLNGRIAHEQKFHFFQARRLVGLVSKAGFAEISVSRTYAGQNLLLRARRPGEILR